MEDKNLKTKIEGKVDGTRVPMQDIMAERYEIL